MKLIMQDMLARIGDPNNVVVLWHKIRIVGMDLRTRNFLQFYDWGVMRILISDFEWKNLT